MRDDGGTFADQPQDAVNDVGDILHDVGRRNPQHLQALRPQPGVATLVPLRLVAVAVALVIDLDGEARFRTVEVQT
jgi:hypothetical protein